MGESKGYMNTYFMYNFSATQISLFSSNLVITGISQQEGNILMLPTIKVIKMTVNTISRLIKPFLSTLVGGGKEVFYQNKIKG